METKFSELELAIHTLVSGFHKAAGGSVDMNVTQFQTMISTQMPKFAEMLEKEEKLPQVLNQMDVKSGDNISFDKFWTLINAETIDLFKSIVPTLQKKSSTCSCALL